MLIREGTGRVVGQAHGYRCKILVGRRWRREGTDREEGKRGTEGKRGEISAYTRRRYLHLVIIQRASRTRTRATARAWEDLSWRKRKKKEKQQEEEEKRTTPGTEQCRRIETVEEKARNPNSQ